MAGKHDGLINESFGNIFRDFAQIKEIGEADETRIDLISQAGFSEDSALRYHFLSFANDFYDFRPTTDYILDGFLKKSLRQLQGQETALSQFVLRYVGDLATFFSNFLKLVRRCQDDPKYFKVFCVLGLSTHLYPLTIRLQSRELLDTHINDHSPLTFMDLIETTDVRVYKTRGTDPAKDISLLACEAANCPAVTIADRLDNIVRRFMGDPSFEGRLIEDMYANTALLHILMEYGEEWTTSQGNDEYSTSMLKQLMQTSPTIEHVFAQIPAFNFPSRGFDTAEQYSLKNDHIGNLSVLEKELNSRCQNKTPEQKLEDENLLKQSMFDTTRALVAEVAASGVNFDSFRVDERTRELASFAKSRWPLW